MAKAEEEKKATKSTKASTAKAKPAAKEKPAEKAAEKASEKAPKAEAKLSLESIVEAVSSLSLLEAAELVKQLEEKLGVSAAAPVAVAAAPMAAGAAAAEPEEEKSEFDVLLKDVGPKKIEVIKAVRQLTALGLREAKEMVDGAPSTVLESASKEAAEDAKSKLEAAGASVEIK
jgi:large subunit ribosomal protein L7/L12